MTTVYIHIGTPKTGTTFLQKLLLDNKDQFLTQGFLFPSSGIPKRPGVIGSTARYSQHNLVWALTKGKNKAYDPNAGDWEDLKKEIDSVKPEYVVISSEFFSKLDYNQISIVRNKLLEYDTKILVYLRRQDDYFQSAYCQVVKSCQYGDSFRNYIIENKIRGNYYYLLEPWKKLFHQKNIIVRLYEKKKSIRALIENFCASINFKFEENSLKYPQPTNLTPDIKVIKIMRYLNNILVGKISSIDRGKMRELYYSYLLKPDNKISTVISKLPDYFNLGHIAKAFGNSPSRCPMKYVNTMRCDVE